MIKTQLAMEHCKKGEWQKAIDVFHSVLETQGDSAEISNNIGTCYLQLGNLETAEKHFLRAQELNPKVPQVYLNLADLYYRLRDFDSGIQLIAQGIYEFADQGSVNLPLRHYLARFYMEDSKLDLAIDELEKILEEQPENYDAYYDLGRVHLELGNYGLAAENFENILEYKNENEWVYYSLGEAYEADNEVDKAISNYLKAIMYNEGFKPAYKKLGILFLARGEHEDAIEYFEDYLKMDLPKEEADKIKSLVERIKNKA